MLLKLGRPRSEIQRRLNPSSTGRMALVRIRKTPHFLLPRCEQFIQDREEKMLLIQRIDIPDRVLSLYQKFVVQQYFEMIGKSGLFYLKEFGKTANALFPVFIQVTKNFYPEIIRQGLEAIGIV